MSSGAAATSNDGPDIPMEQRRVYHENGAEEGGAHNEHQYYEDVEGREQPHEGEGDGQQVYVDHYEPDGFGGYSVTKKLVDSRLARKQAEDDVKLLANRIALLKMEE